MNYYSCTYKTAVLVMELYEIVYFFYSTTANLIADDNYWKRCCKTRWKICDVSCYGNCWRRMFFEKNLEGNISYLDKRLLNELFLHILLFSLFFGHI